MPDLTNMHTRIKIASVVAALYVVNLVFLVVMANTDHVNVIRYEGIGIGIPGIVLGLWLFCWLLAQQPFGLLPKKTPHPFQLFQLLKGKT